MAKLSLIFPWVLGGENGVERFPIPRIGYFRKNILKNRLFDQTWGGLESVTLVGYWLVILHPHPNYPQKRTGFSNIAGLLKGN